MTKLLLALAVTALVGVWAVPAPAADEKKPLKHLEGQIFDQILAKHQDMTFDQLKGKAVKPREYPGLDFDPTKTTHFDTVKTKLAITDAELAIFKKTGFVSIDQNRRHSFASAYYQIYAADLPVLVTTDSIMHALHKSYDDILMEMERTVFTETMRTILRDVHDAVGGVEKTNTHARDVDLYVTVARNLLEGAGGQPGDPIGWDGKIKVASKFGQDDAALALLGEVRTLKLKDPLNGDKPISIYGGERYPDFSQFRPRGHYTKFQELRNYFRCLMWLGRVDCGWNVLPTEASRGVKADSDRELRNAILFCQLLRDAKSLPALKSLDDIIGFMVGKSDNLTVFTLLDVMGGAKVKGLSDALDAKNLDKVKDELKSGKHAGQMIRSQLLISSPGSSIKTPPPAVFQVFGQRFVVDSFVLSQVVFDSILFKNQKQRRMMPAGLDAMAALGNDEALLLLEPELKKWNYSANLMACRDFIGLHPEAYWKSNLYVLWLDCLRTLNADLSANKKFPQAMKSKAWQMKQLNTQLGSWAELRHDTILYAKQSYTARPDCEYPAGYVEPYPEFYAKVKFFADEAGKLITAAEFPAGHPKKHYIAFFKQMSETVGTLETLAKKELAGEAFTDAEKLFLKKTVDRRGGGSGPPRYDGWYPNLFYDRGECAEWAPVVADVHTDPELQSCLEVAVGDAMFGVIAIDNDKDRMTYVGPLYSYYEFTQNVEKRLTDPEWQQMIQKGTLPARPEWTKDFVAPVRKK